MKRELDVLAAAKEAFGAEKAEIIKELEDHKRKLEEVQPTIDLAEGENAKLRAQLSNAEQRHSVPEAEVNRLQAELDAVVKEEEGESDANKVEMVKELEDLKKLVEEMQAEKDVLKGENDKLRSEALTKEQDYVISEAEFKRLQSEFSALADVKEADAKAFDADKAKLA
jgi:chromosome segregation ATPase